MSLNKFMHPRNKYRKPPDFKALAAKYPDFNKLVKRDGWGNVSLDFKNPKSLQALTTTLLKEDFDLNVEIPVNPQIPTIPLYMNYLLWLEDLVAANTSSEVIQGVEIGCTASCVYSLLAARQFHWRMLATEVDTDSAFTASNNIRRNKLNDRITVRAVKKGTVLQGVLEPGVVYDFCMCNSLRYLTSREELLTLLTALVLDSIELKEQIRIYTVKVADETTVATLMETLKKAGVTRVSSKMFCQGRTTRWGVAWTLGFAELDLGSQSLKQNIPFSQTVRGDLPGTVEQLLQLIAKLQITHSILKRNEELCTMEITAMNNTWSNVEKRTRQITNNKDCYKETLNTPNSEENNEPSVDGNNKNEDQTEIKEENKDDEKGLPPKETAGSSQIKIGVDEKATTNFCGSNVSEKSTEEVAENGVGEKIATDVGEKTKAEVVGNGIGEKIMADVGDDCRIGKKRGSIDDLDAANSDMKRLKMKNGSSEVNIGPQRGPVLTASLVVRKTSSGSVVEMNWLRGPGGRNSAQQLLQYLTSNLNPPADN
ncbi:RNA N6-adenosine-methyltransferase mettl16-like [Homalodisca vitripennis]|uniref:RNA N6-adenosine-methyltransferase mettl16-like n=1 Tax=Homalodisca vitripennis TaxID=197043 RepID=UPI001EECF080|nr:RNA N6-adenosine-methyltransferase mettl16-like [Homalodisca vitripennis]